VDSTALSAAFQVGRYPDEAPALPDAAFHEHDTQACACVACFGLRRERLDAEVVTVLERIGADEESDPAEWAPEWDAFVWEPTEPGLSFVAQVEAEARRLKLRDSLVTDFLHAELLALAAMVRRTGATCPAEFEARREIEEHDLLRDYESRGWDAGYSAGLAAAL
jgi:hypothetical protein